MSMLPPLEGSNSRWKLSKPMSPGDSISPRSRSSSPTSRNRAVILLTFPVTGSVLDRSPKVVSWTSKETE